MSFLFGLSAGETHDFKWPGLPGKRQDKDDFAKNDSRFHQGTATNQPASIPTDPQIAAINPAGVEIVETELHL